MSYTPLPIGVDDFEKLRTNGYYYVDKTGMIKELIDKKGEVNLFTRPRRFGKTLNLSMLQCFFEKREEKKSRKELFRGLQIMDAGESYTSLQERYPVVMLTLKSAKQPSYELAHACLIEAVAREFRRHRLEGKLKDGIAKEKYIRIMNEKASESEYLTSLAFLTECLREVYDQNTIVLIDEYDVPLENAFYAGFYNEMTAFIRSLFESVLKSNPYLEFAVVTGCLRISKESIFTGLNNLEINSVLSKEYGEYFGFVEEEVKKLLSFYDREQKMDIMREWYDGYLFGDAAVYNPWSVLKYTKDLNADSDALPMAAWSNTSSNSIIKDLIYRSDKVVQREIELLVSGQTIEKQVHEEITYEDIYASEDNLWNFLFYTGYLRQNGKRMMDDKIYLELAVPNREVRTIYRSQIENWFRDEVKVQNLSVLYDGMLTGKVETFQKELTYQLQKTISYMDNGESFYHGFLLGLMANLKEHFIKSNREAGFGRYDILIYSLDVSVSPVILELKTADKYSGLDDACRRALNQIEQMEYDKDLSEEGYTEVICYGIGFFKKQLRIHMKRRKLND
ncbi:MAG: AAA family ATPase [Lachnospiraceae bacterium]|nr:AAA family ATPase [Lachnospiraceae bacterium]